MHWVCGMHLGGWQVVTTRSARGGPKVTISSSNLYNTLFCFRSEKKMFCWTSHTINPLFSVLVGWLFSGEEQVPPFPSVQRSTLPGGKAFAATTYLVWPKQPSSNSRRCPPTAHLFGHCNLVIWGETWPKPQPRCDLCWVPGACTERKISKGEEEIRPHAVPLKISP